MMKQAIPMRQLLWTAWMILILTLSSGTALAAGASPLPDAASQSIQTASSDTATVILGKTLTASKYRENKFPRVHDFYYTITRVRAWDNANVDTAKNGKVMAVSDMPMPRSAVTAHHQVSVQADTATVALGDFLGDTEGVNTPTRRERTTAVEIPFTKAGYYVYKVKEVQSTDPALASIDYDPNEYFMVFYVCNQVDAEGNTVDGVYVHNITSWTNEAGSESYQPDLTDIQNVTDHQGRPAGTNSGSVTYHADGTVSIVHEDLGKVGVATGNRLEAYRMWNGQSTRDVVIKKNVTGNLGDRSKEFAFTVSLTGLEPEQTYTTDTAAEYTADRSDVLITSISAGVLGNGNRSFTATASGTATFLVKLTDDQSFVINDLPLTAQYTVREAASDHVASYRITSANENGAGGSPEIVSDQAANEASDQMLETAQETVDRFDGTIVITYTNNRDLAAITGVAGMDTMVYALVLALMLLAGWAILRRRKQYADELAA